MRCHQNTSPKDEYIFADNHSQAEIKNCIVIFIPKLDISIF
jgi:hypothetical protein